MDGVHAMDATGLVALESALDQLDQHGCLAILCAIKPQPLGLIAKARVPSRKGVLLCANPAEAVAAARAHLDLPPPATDVPASPAAA
jgi:hypothetical protein